MHTKIAQTEISSIVNNIQLLVEQRGGEAANHLTNALIPRISLGFISDSSGFQSDNPDKGKSSVCVCGCQEETDPVAIR